MLHTDALCMHTFAELKAKANFQTCILTCIVEGKIFKEK